jgi:hypothetical protein
MERDRPLAAGKERNGWVQRLGREEEGTTTRERRRGSVGWQLAQGPRRLIGPALAWEMRALA